MLARELNVSRDLLRFHARSTSKHDHVSFGQIDDSTERSCLLCPFLQARCFFHKGHIHGVKCRFASTRIFGVVEDILASSSVTDDNSQFYVTSPCFCFFSTLSSTNFEFFCNDWIVLSHLMLFRIVPWFHLRRVFLLLVGKCTMFFFLSRSRRR